MSILPRRTALAIPAPDAAEITDVHTLVVAGIPAVTVTLAIGMNQRVVLLGLADAEAAALRMLSAVATARNRWAA